MKELIPSYLVLRRRSKFVKNRVGVASGWWVDILSKITRISIWWVKISSTAIHKVLNDSNLLNIPMDAGHVVSNVLIAAWTCFRSSIELVFLIIYWERPNISLEYLTHVGMENPCKVLFIEDQSTEELVDIFHIVSQSILSWRAGVWTNEVMRWDTFDVKTLWISSSLRG